MAKLELNNIVYRYASGNVDVLKNISARFEGGKLYAIVGPSGSGKTTLLSIMAGLDSPTSGDIRVDDVSLSEMDLDKYRRENVSMIFQAFQLFPLLTAIENVCFPMEYKGVNINEARKVASQTLSALGIDGTKQNRYPTALSGGEQQRVAIGRTLATGAKIILADEPTGNLDGENSKKIVEILQNLSHDDGYCIIIVTHDMAVANASDEIWRIEDGVLTKVK